jgi:hypothetical protein
LVVVSFGAFVIVVLSLHAPPALLVGLRHIAGVAGAGNLMENWICRTIATMLFVSV